MDECSLKEQLSQKEEIIECLQAELVKVRLREAENDALIRDLKARTQELEEVRNSRSRTSGQFVTMECANTVVILFQDKKTLRESTVDNSVAHLQEELIAVKLREAEANLSLKDLRQRVNEISAQWQRHLQVIRNVITFCLHFTLRIYEKCI